MTVDKFGRHESSFAHDILRGPPGEGFELTPDGHYDLKRKRVCNLADPMNNEEAVNLYTVRSLTLNCETINGMYDAKHKRILNIASPTADTDAVNRIFVLHEIKKLKKDLYDKIDNLSSKVFHLVHSSKENSERTAGDGNSLYTRIH